VLRTTIRIIAYYEVTDIDVIAAALLHDAVEDHPEELAGDRPGDATEAALVDRFNGSSRSPTSPTTGSG
jgi:hypothetical protein